MKTLKNKLIFYFLLLFFTILLFHQPVSAATKVSLNKQKITLCMGKKATLNIVGSSQKATWSTSNKKVAKVTSNGKITAVTPGVATITAKIGSKKYNCKVTVVSHKYDKKTYKCKYCGQVLNDKVVESNINAMKVIFPDKMKWNSTNSYSWHGGILMGGYGCVAFAFKLSDIAFDELPARKTYNFDNIRVGDVVRVNNNTHSIICIKKSGNTYYFAAGNVNGKVTWNNKYTLKQIKKIGDYIFTRYP